MEPIYFDLHIHTSTNANNPNEDYDVSELVSQIKSDNATIPKIADAQNIVYCKNECGKITKSQII